MYLVAILLYICYAKAKNGLPGSQSSAGGLNQKKRYYMKQKKIGLGSISLLLVIVAVLWSYNISGYCLGDQILHTLNLPAWSNEAATPERTLSIVPFGHEARGVHYTVFYALILLVPAFLLAIKNKEDLFAKVGKWFSLVLTLLLLISPLFMIL